MPPDCDQEAGTDAHNPNAPVQPAYLPKRSLFRQPSAPPPPYTAPPTPNVSRDSLPLSHLTSHAAAMMPLRHQNHTEAPSRRLPSPPRPRNVTSIELERATASPSRSELQPRSTSSLPQTSPSAPLSPSPNIPKARSVFRPFTALKLSKATRNATAQIAKQATWKAAEEAERARLRAAEEEAAARERDEELRRRAAAEAEARETVKTCIWSLLLSGHPTEEGRMSAFSNCSKACRKVGLDLSAVLQDPLIEGQTPVYWAILNRPVEASEIDHTASDAFITALLNACGPLNETTIASVRLACMLMSNNALLQHLFWNFPGLSPLSTRDRMLLGPSGRGDIVNVEETHDGTGTFIADMKIRRFRLRMNVSAAVKVVFVTFERIWTATFSVSTQPVPGGSSEIMRLFSLELGKNSMPAWVNADLLVSGHSPQSSGSDSNEPIFSVPVNCGRRALHPGPKNAIGVRLDDGPMGLHWINESLALVDADGTLHAQLKVRLTQPETPVSPPASPDHSDTWSQVSSALGTQASSSHSDPPRPTNSRSRDNRAVNNPDKPVFTSLRRGGR